jgi:hypothetical protein
VPQLQQSAESGIPIDLGAKKSSSIFSLLQFNSWANRRQPQSQHSPNFFLSFYIKTIEILTIKVLKLQPRGLIKKKNHTTRPQLSQKANKIKPLIMGTLLSATCNTPPRAPIKQRLSPPSCNHPIWVSNRGIYR